MQSVRRKSWFALSIWAVVIVADMLSKVADSIFETQPAQIPCVYCWVGAIVYSLQIYFDFSGNSDMAMANARTRGALFAVMAVLADVFAMTGMVALGIYEYFS